jgi:peptide/nickel transport system permease protein
MMRERSRRTRQAKYVLRRLTQAIITVVCIILINFTILHLAPGDAVDVLAGEAGTADPAMMAEMRARLGLDQPLPVQFAAYAKELVSLNLGYSFHSNASVFDLIVERLPATLLLMLPSIILAFSLGVLLGVIAARRLNSWTDAVISVVALCAFAAPLFWLGLMLIVLFTLKLGLLPSGGMETIGGPDDIWTHTYDVIRHMILPVLTLALFYTAAFARLMRASMLEVTGMAFVRTARAKGLSELRVTWRHIFRNAVLPVVTMMGLHVATLLGGAVVVEVVFSWPGMGRLAFDAVLQRDNSLLLGLLFFCSLLVAATNLAIDLLYSRLDPRIEMR